MAIALSIQQYLEDLCLPFEVMTHDATHTSQETAHATAISENNLAKGVLIRRKDGYLLAVVPASRQVTLNDLGTWLNQTVGLATEEEIAGVFEDCALGAIPPIAGAYGLPAVVDESLEGFSDVYFEGGDHRTLVHMTGREFQRMMAKFPHGRFSAPRA